MLLLFWNPYPAPASRGAGNYSKSIKIIDVRRRKKEERRERRKKQRTVREQLLRALSGDTTPFPEEYEWFDPATGEIVAEIIEQIEQQFHPIHVTQPSPFIPLSPADREQLVRALMRVPDNQLSAGPAEIAKAVLTELDYDEEETLLVILAVTLQ